jgi:hypothetical protein
MSLENINSRWKVKWEVVHFGWILQNVDGNIILIVYQDCKNNLFGILKK